MVVANPRMRNPNKKLCTASRLEKYDVALTTQLADIANIIPKPIRIKMFQKIICRIVCPP
jgi:hypothetical protein